MRKKIIRENSLIRAYFTLDHKEMWELYFGGASNKRVFGIKTLLISPDSHQLPTTIKLTYEWSSTSLSS